MGSTSRFRTRQNCRLERSSVPEVAPAIPTRLTVPVAFSSPAALPSHPALGGMDKQVMPCEVADAPDAPGPGVWRHEGPRN